MALNIDCNYSFLNGQFNSSASLATQKMSSQNRYLKKKSTKLRTEIFNSNNKTSIIVRVPAVTLLISFIGIDRVISMHKNPLWVTSKHISSCLFCFSMRRTNKLQIQLVTAMATTSATAAEEERPININSVLTLPSPNSSVPPKDVGDGR